MGDLLKKHRVIGIRHTLKEIKDAGLISEDINYPADAVDELKRIQARAATARRHRSARSDSSLPGLIKEIESIFNLPEGSVQLVYPSGQKTRAYGTVGTFRKNWERNGG